MHYQDEYSTTDDYFDSLNMLGATFGLTTAAACLKMKPPAPFAWVFFVVLLVLVFTQNKERRKLAARNMAQYRGTVGGVVLLWRLTVLSSELNGGDGLNFNAAGYKRLADTVNYSAIAGSHCFG